MGTSRQPLPPLALPSERGAALGPLLLLGPLPAEAPSAPGVLLSTTIGSDWLEGPSKAVTCGVGRVEEGAGEMSGPAVSRGYLACML